MRIVSYLNCTAEEIEAKRFNIVVGVSLGNKYFTKEHIAAYIRWALDHTSDDVLIVVPEVLHAITLSVTLDRSGVAAVRKANKLADEKITEIEGIIATLPGGERGKVAIARWRDVSQSKYHHYRTECVFGEFRKRGEFFDRVMAISQEYNKNSPKNFSEADYERLAEYILYEIPMFLNSVTYRSREQGGKKYNLMPYPGLGGFDFLVDDIQTREWMPDFTKKLKIEHKMAMVEAYVE